MTFSQRVIAILKEIPEGKVVTYGQIAAMAGNPRGARGVVWILRSSSRKYNLPWHRVVAAGGRISLPEGAGFEEQAALLAAEGIIVNNGKIDLKNSLWQPDRVYPS